MNDSDLDFVDLCSKLLKRVRKKPDDPRQPKKDENHSSSQASEGDKSRRKHRKEEREKLSATQPAGNRGEQPKLSGPESGDAGSSSAVSGGQRAKEIVLERMQQFKRSSPQKMHKDPIQAPGNDEDSSSVTQHQRGDFQTFSSDRQKAPPEDSDEVLALRLQQELDKESAQAQIVDLEDGGLFFCQICHKDLSHMTPEGRTQHINRCLDESEDSAPAPAAAAAPSSGIPDCPICGKKFKSQKSRCAHLKRCSSDMGVSPAVLLQALQRQAEERQSVASTSTDTQTSGTKRKGPPKSGLPARKRPRTKQEPLDEETMVALALSSSLQEQERQGAAAAERLLQTESGASHSCRTAALTAGRGRGKRRKGGVPRPPPLLLVQNAEAALTRLQERVSALLLRGRAPSPPTPTRCPSTVPGWEGAAPLWQRSSLLDAASTGPAEFYSPELREFFTISGSVTINAILNNKPESSVHRVGGETPSCGAEASMRPSPSTPGTGQLLVGSQALQDLMELAEDGMTLTQCGYDGKGQPVGAGQTTNLRLSGFVQEEEEEEEELCASGFLPETVRQSAAHRRASGTTDRRRASRGRSRSEPLSRLESDLSSMVNNPQLSDVQLQVDSGEVFFAHSFMVYARCPLLAEMVHESGFGVQEEGLPAAQRVLLSDVPDEAVLVLLQYLYTGRGAVPAPLQPHVLELAARFDLQELLQLCQEAGPLPDEATRTDQEENVNNQTDQAFMELLRSMWVEGEEEEDGSDSDGGRREGRQVEEDGEAAGEAADREMEEQVNEKELEEIYEFAATQRKKEVEDSEEEEEVEERLHDEEDDGASAFTKLQPDSQLHPSLDRSFDRLFSESWGVYEEGDSGTPKTRPSEPEQQQQPPSKPPAELSCGALLQSSADNLSLSPSPRSSSLPVPGPSPLQLTAGQRDDAAERDSRGPGSVCAPPSPAPEPELIVLSDSSEDMEVDAPGPSPPSPRVPHTPQSYTEIRPIQTPPPPEPAVKNKESSGEKWSPGAPLDCSPEVSWLIPSTPPRPGRSPPTPTTTSSSTQTRSSMSRTQLFPKVEASPPPSCRFSSLLRLSCSPGVSEDADTAAPSQTKPSHPSPSLSIPAPPHSSTPLHTEHLLPAPPRHIHPSQCESRGGRSESLGSFQLTQNRRSKSSQQRAAESRRGDESAAVMDTERATAWADEDAGDAEGETREAEEAESSFRPSFGAMDDPPIAFDDSWGLDACADAGPGRFSLRLEDSGPSSHQTPERSSSSASHPAPSSPAVQDSLTEPPAPREPRSQSSSSAEPKPGPSVTSPPDPNARTTAELDEDLLDSRMWDSWGEEVEEEEEVVPLSQRLNPPAQLKTPNLSHSKRRHPMVPITPMPHYSDMDTPELKNKLNRFGVRPLPKRQMILKLKEIHQYTHQLLSSDSEDEARGKPPPGRPAEFREPPAPPPATQRGQDGEEEEEDGEEEPLSASQGSNTSSTAESERSNPELCVSSSGDSDGDVSSSQAASRLQDRLLAVRALILSDAELYSRILHYEPLVLSQLQRQLKAAGIRLGATKLVDYLDSQCITFTTAKPGHRRGHGGGRGARGGARRKRGASTML
ncbi:structure-specific endonuclease subunit SLX4 [Salarias fasciatus]|uniref:structure-specific endonuclease subunit SLX4 n=1 Tax=Salarias fasciatus TaxID=181472 RepID=UPI00117673A7|nr:structure-specific endonuclease subunit SLX4 [Salarias fasciatus]